MDFGGPPAESAERRPPTGISIQETAQPPEVCPDDPTGTVSDTSGGQGVPPEPASGDATQDRTLDTPERSPDEQIHPRWATTSWWRVVVVVIVVEITVLVVLGYMALWGSVPVYRDPGPETGAVPRARDPLRNCGIRVPFLFVLRAGNILRSLVVSVR